MSEQKSLVVKFKASPILPQEIRFTEGETFNVSFAAGTATIATNNDLDVLSDTQFAKVPTIEKDEALSEVAENGFVTKKQLLAQIAILQAQIEALK